MVERDAATNSSVRTGVIVSKDVSSLELWAGLTLAASETSLLWGRVGDCEGVDWWWGGNFLVNLDYQHCLEFESLDFNFQNLKYLV